MHDIHVTERDTAKFECELSVTDLNVKWLVNEQVVESGAKYAVLVDGKKHQLIFNKCQLYDDDSKVKCTCGDLLTEATLVVECE